MESELLPEGARGAPEDTYVGASAHTSESVGTMYEAVEAAAIPYQRNE